MHFKIKMILLPITGLKMYDISIQLSRTKYYFIIHSANIFFFYSIIKHSLYSVNYIK